MTDALIHMRVPAETKARWVRESRNDGKRLTDWIVEKVERKETRMITNIELAPSGVEKFNRFFADYAKEGVSMQAVMFEVLDIMQDRVSMDESLVYELGKHFTSTGRPEILTLDSEDISVTEEPDDE